jgi:hypothetical protein
MTETKAPKFEGEVHRLGERQYTVPPLNWRRIRELLPVLQKIRIGQPGLEITEEMLDDYLTVILAALNRNYPKMTKDELEDLLDLGNAPRLFLAIMGMSGLIQGEPRPGIADPSIGDGSTLT